jgi:sugar lactone lactonase YvrE
MSGFAPVLEAGTLLGESPVWEPETQTLMFVDITGRRLHRFAPATGLHDSAAIDEEIGCVAPHRAGGFIAGLRSGLWHLGPAGDKRACLAANPEPAATSRFNDGRTDPAGRFFAGTIDESRAGTACLYRYDKRGLVRLETGLRTSNGLAFAPDGRSLYHSDTPRFVVHVYDYDPATGAAERRRPFVLLDPDGPDRGRPDGAAVDADGCYWTALYEGRRVHRYDPAGRLLAAFAVPVAKPTMVAFGGADLRTLFLTTACDPGDAVAGALWAMRVATPGLPSVPFDPEV